MKFVVTYFVLAALACQIGSGMAVEKEPAAKPSEEKETKETAAIPSEKKEVEGILTTIHKFEEKEAAAKPSGDLVELTEQQKTDGKSESSIAL